MSEDNAHFCSVDGVLYSKDKTQLLCCPGGRKGEYTIPEGVEEIAVGAFDGCAVTKVTIPSSVKRIGSGAFARCAQLVDVTIPDPITVLPAGLFQGCAALQRVRFSPKLTAIEDGVFQECSSLVQLDIPQTVQQIGENAFSSCSSLKVMVIPEGITRLENGLFHGCSELVDIRLPESLTFIGWDVFDGCSSLKTLNIPAGVTTMGEEAYINDQSLFRGCDQVTIYGAPGSYAQEVAQKHTIPFSSDDPPAVTEPNLDEEPPIEPTFDFTEDEAYDEDGSALPTSARSKEDDLSATKTILWIIALGGVVFLLVAGIIVGSIRRKKAADKEQNDVTEP